MNKKAAVRRDRAIRDVGSTVECAGAPLRRIQIQRLRRTTHGFAAIKSVAKWKRLLAQTAALASAGA